MSSNPAAPWPNAAPPLSVALHGLTAGTTLTAQVEREGETLRLRLGPPSGALLRLVWAFAREGRKLVLVQAPESGAPLVAAEVCSAGTLTGLPEADLAGLRSAPGTEALRLLLMNERAVRAELEGWVAALFRADPARGTSAEVWQGRLTASFTVDGLSVKAHDAAGIDEVEKRPDQVPNVRLGYQGRSEWFRVLRVTSDTSGAFLVLGPADGTLAAAHPVVALSKSWSVEALPAEVLTRLEAEVLRSLLAERPATIADLDDIRGLVNLGGPRVPGSFAITDRGEAAGEIVLRGRQQFGASQRRHEAEYLVRTLFEHGGRGYAVLHLPKSLADKDEVPPRILARVDGRTLLVFPDDAAWHEVAPAARQAMATCRPLDRELASRIFGASVVSTASLPGIPVVRAEPGSLAPTPRSTSIEVSHRLGVPVLLEGPSVGRTIVWRGIPLAAPPRLETIESGATVPILQRFVHKDVPYLRIHHPGPGIHCDYALRWISGDLVLLQIAHGWPGPEARRLVVAKRLDQDNLQTLHMRESLRALGQIYPEMERGGRLTPAAAAEVFGPMGDASVRIAPASGAGPTATTQRVPVFAAEPEVGAGAPALVGAVLPGLPPVSTSETLPPTLPPPDLAELLSPQPPATPGPEPAVETSVAPTAPEVARPPSPPEVAPAPEAPPPVAVPVAPAAPARPVPVAAASSGSEDAAQPRVTCLRCEKPVGESDATCPHCGVSRLAPPCPHCAKPVSKSLEMRAWLKDESGNYPWHARWDRRCAHCGFEFARRIKLPSGHAHFGSTGEAVLAVEAGESAYTVFDFWDHLPTVTVSVKRASPRSDGKPLGDLPGEQQITLTPEEWRAVIDQLEGPLSPLLERRRWTRDTT